MTLKRKRSDESPEVGGARASDQQACRDDTILRLPKQNGELATFLYTDGGRHRRDGFKLSEVLIWLSRRLTPIRQDTRDDEPRTETGSERFTMRAVNRSDPFARIPDSVQDAIVTATEAIRPHAPLLVGVAAAVFVGGGGKIVYSET